MRCNYSVSARYSTAPDTLKQSRCYMSICHLKQDFVGESFGNNNREILIDLALFPCVSIVVSVFVHLSPVDSPRYYSQSRLLREKQIFVRFYVYWSGSGTTTRARKSVKKGTCVRTSHSSWWWIRSKVAKSVERSGEMVKPGP